MTYQTAAQLVDEGKLKHQLDQLASANREFSLYCINFTDSSNTRGSDRSIVNDKLLVDVANLMIALLGTRIVVSKTNKDRLEIILPGMKKDDAITNAGQLREKLEAQFNTPGLGIAIGLSNHPVDTDEKLDARHLAVAGADEATKLGMNRIFAAISQAEREAG